jgi:Protein of unknown function DUF262
MIFSPTEVKIWQKTPEDHQDKKTDIEINNRYESQERRIVTESNREKLPNFVEALKRPSYMDLRPFYQRRARWNDEKKSKLIESFIVNVPIPPIILYEKELGSYEVMDGQQRVSAIKSFYENEFKLKKLEMWPELNGRTYTTLPSKIRAGIDRRSIASIVILKESAANNEEAMLLKQLTFERLNTGGVKLAPQEVRNCVYQGDFNTLVRDKLSRNPIFTEAWNIPDMECLDLQNPPKELAENKLFTDMEDVELVLRFFALRHADQFRRGLKGFLDLYMVKSLDFKSEDILFLESLFLDTIKFAHAIYEENLFKPYDPLIKSWKESSHKAVYDSVMIGFCRHLENQEILVSKKDRILEESRYAFENDHKKLLTGGGKGGKSDLQDRLNIIDNILTKVVKE